MSKSNKHYRVLTPVRHLGVTHAPGVFLRLPDDIALPLLDGGCLSEEEPPAPPKTEGEKGTTPPHSTGTDSGKAPDGEGAV